MFSTTIEKKKEKKMFTEMGCIEKRNTAQTIRCFSQHWGRSTLRCEASILLMGDFIIHADLHIIGGPHGWSNGLEWDMSLCPSVRLCRTITHTLLSCTDAHRLKHAVELYV